MGFFASELAAVLQAHVTASNADPWTLLTRLEVHPLQIDRLRAAAQEVESIATLPPPLLQQLKHEFALAPLAWYRLEAGIEADAFLRLLLYHSYSVEEAVTRANGIFAGALRDRLAVGAAATSIYPDHPDLAALAQVPPPVRHRGRMRNAEKAALLAQQRAEAAARVAAIAVPAAPPAEPVT